MKKFIILLSMLMLVGCGDNQEKKESQSSPESTMAQMPSIEIASNKPQKGEDKVAKFTSYDVRGNRVIDIAPEGEGNSTTKKITAVALIRNPYLNINVSLLEKHLGYNFLVKCSACHNDYANGVIGPSLLDKSESEISDMIKAYRSKTEENVLMHELVAKMPDEEINSLARDISEFNAEVKRIKDENR